jgi:hypothetical protein
MRRSMIIRRDLRKKGLARMINLSKDLGFCVVPDSTAQVCASKRLQASPSELSSAPLIGRRVHN